MIQPGKQNLKKIAVVGRGTAGSLAVAAVVEELGEHEYQLHHIYDSNIPIIGVGEGSWPSLVRQLQQYTQLPLETLQKRLNATRKYGIQFEGWGCTNRNFIHHFSPKQVAYAYHLAADLIVEILQENSPADHIDANVTSISRDGECAKIEFKERPPETYDLVFDARGFPKSIEAEEHLRIQCIPTNASIIRRGPALVEQHETGLVVRPTYTRAVARPHGWIFVIPLTVHTSYGYIYNQDVTNQSQVEEDFDKFLERDGVREFEQRAIIPFPNFVHNQIYDGVIARVGNAGSFLEPLEATAIVIAQMEIGMVLRTRLSRSIDHLALDAPTVNRFLRAHILRHGLFVGWHYSQGSKYDSPFWRFAKEDTWSSHRETTAPERVDCSALDHFDEMMAVLRKPVIDPSEWEKNSVYPLTSYTQIAQGLGY